MYRPRGPAQLGGAGTGIGGLFGLGSGNDLARHVIPDAGLQTAAQRLLHRAIFEAVKTDQRHATTGRDQSGQRRQQPLELAEFVVHGDSQRLESTHRRVAGMMAGDGCTNDLGEIGVGLQRVCSHRLLDRARHAPRQPLFAIAEDDIGEVGLAQPRHQLERGFRAAVAHAHVRRHIIGAPRESALGPIQLQARHPEIGKHSDKGFTAPDQILDRIGAVNLDAMREHEDAEKRFVFYTEQKADLEKALGDLEKAIAQMNKESKRLFAETFAAVNAKFEEIFPRMFRGGRGSLKLTNPDDMLETGIDILAQPPGKKLSSIELMSGGEKALTAVSLIFAIFQVKPSPFCILDEVDAPLDEANVSRYNEMVRSMTAKSQFILITHIKKTMQMVDILYGVTMQEAGVSRLVSVRLNEAAEAQKPDMKKAAEPTETDTAAVA